MVPRFRPAELMHDVGRVDLVPEMGSHRLSAAAVCFPASRLYGIRRAGAIFDQD